MASNRADLAAMMYPLSRALIAAELPILTAHEISMWGYAVLNALVEQPIRTQSALATAIGADKTRIIGVLDELQDRALIERTPDPDDRRAHQLAITEQGRAVRDAVQTDIQRGEERLLTRLSAADRRAFLRALEILAELPPEEITYDR
ncbi:MAG TPA: MarR family transcriptional regulator [Pseudonocardiaceae bacterium]|jgi:DNA-binding MarR family transcriptional regulator|nr:MarR family transcriptional regulator [Pseudonocardiaceae bacterium]